MSHEPMKHWTEVLGMHPPLAEHLAQHLAHLRKVPQGGWGEEAQEAMARRELDDLRVELARVEREREAVVAAWDERVASVRQRLEWLESQPRPGLGARVAQAIPTQPEAEATAPGQAKSRLRRSRRT